MLGRAVGEMTSVGCGNQRPLVAGSVLEILSSSQVATIELVGPVIELSDLGLGRNARVDAPDVLRPPQVVATTEIHVRGAVDRKTPVLVHHQAVVVVLKLMLRVIL